MFSVFCILSFKPKCLSSNIKELGERKKMTLLVYVITGLAVVVGLAVAVWSYADTREKYYQEYINRKKNDQKHHIPR